MTTIVSGMFNMAFLGEKRDLMTFGFTFFNPGN